MIILSKGGFYFRIFTFRRVYEMN